MIAGKSALHKNLNNVLQHGGKPKNGYISKGKKPANSLFVLCQKMKVLLCHNLFFL